MQEIIQRLNALRRQSRGWLGASVETLAHFVDIKSGTYRNYDPHPTTGPHPVSTSRAVATLMDNPWVVDTKKRLPSIASCYEICSKPRAPKGTWSSDPAIEPNIYEASQVLYAFSKAKCISNPDFKLHVEVLQSFVLSFDPTSPLRGSQRDPQDHPFFLFLATKALHEVKQLSQEARATAEAAFLTELATQLSLLQAEDSYAFEIVRLGLAVAGLLLIGTTYHTSLIDAGRDEFLRHQLQDESWAPIRHSVRLDRRFIGCSPLEPLLTIIECSQSTWITSNAAFFEHLFHSLDEHNIGTADAPRWSLDTSPESALWFNCLVLDFLSAFEAKLALCISEAALAQLPVRASFGTITWEQLPDTGFKKVLEERVLSQLRGRTIPDTALSHIPLGVILFGPPGTSKTTLVRAVAQELVTWPLVEVTPRDLLRSGLDSVLTEAERLFNYLLELRSSVVLFDEMDELVAERAGESDKLSRFLTTGMLPLLQELRDRGSVLFFFLTNHIERYDEAIRRPGRFDLVLPVGPLDREQQRQLLISLVNPKNKKSHLDAAFGVLAGDHRTSREMIDLASYLKPAKSKDWRAIVTEWSNSHPTAINHDSIVRFQECKTKHARS